MVFMQINSWDKNCAILEDDVIVKCKLWWENFYETDICEVLYELFFDLRSKWRLEVSQGKEIIINYFFENWALLVVEITCLGSGFILHTLYYNS